MKNNSEITVWYSFLSGDKTAFTVIFKLYYNTLYNYGLKISNNPSLTKDCIQNLFVYLFTHRKGIKEVTSVKAYIITSFKRLLFKELKKERRFVNYTLDMLSNSSFEFSPEEITVRQEISAIKSEALTNILNTLSPREREAIYLKYYSELKITEISLIMNISYQSVLNTIQKAFKKIRQESEKEMIMSILKK